VDDGETRRDVENAVHIKNAKISLKLTTNRVLVRACACSVCVCVCVGARQPARWFFVCLHVCILGHATLPKNACEGGMRERGGEEGPQKIREYRNGRESSRNKCNSICVCVWGIIFEKLTSVEKRKKCVRVISKIK